VSTAALRTNNIRANRKSDSTQPPKPPSFITSTHGWIENLVGDNDLTCAAIRVGVTLAMFVSHPEWTKTGKMYCWPSRPYIGGLLELRRYIVGEAINELANRGYIRIENNRFRLVSKTCETSPS
jgi:hypothetical protein